MIRNCSSQYLKNKRKKDDNNPSHLTKMAAMPLMSIYGKSPSKIFSRTGGPISTKLGMKCQWLKYCTTFYDLDHDLFYSKVNLGHIYMHVNGKKTVTVKMSLKF